MEALPFVLLALVMLAVGLTLGTVFGAARARAEGATLASDASAAAARADALAQQLEQERSFHRGIAEQHREEDRRREERDQERAGVLRALAPVQETLHAMQNKVDGLERDRQHQFGSLAEQLRRHGEAGEALRLTTESLAGALRSPSVRGVWGEAQLRRVVEAAGLTRYVDFDLQATVRSDQGQGRPDLVVRLPGGKAIAVDAKAPMAAYLEAQEIPLTAQGDAAARRAQLMAQHVKAVRAHVDALAKKRYWEGLPSSPEFVICFIPSESLLAAALDEDPALLDYAFQRRVALASPVNLWAVLKTISYIWTQQDVSDQARELFDLGNELYQRLGGLATHMQGLRKAIVRTVESYNGFAGSLERRVLVSARKFPGIDATRLDDAAAPELIDTAPRLLVADEFHGDEGVADGAAHDDTGGQVAVAGETVDVARQHGDLDEPGRQAGADLGAVRDRIADVESDRSGEGVRQVSRRERD